MREAADRQEAHTIDPIVQIHDAEEYQSYLRDRRKHFEDNIRYRREHIGNWVKYARLEEEHKEFERARSIFERALEVDGRSAELWLRYAEFEMRNEFVNHARNILDRAIQLLPRVDFLWYKYVYMEELVRDIPKCRAIFERWMKWMPDDNAWLSYARFETRCGSLDRAEAVMRRYVNAYPSAKAFLKFAKWAEYEAKHIDLARSILEACLSELEPEESRQAHVFQKFASFEERQGEYERARVIYEHSIKLLHLGESMTKAMDEDISEWETNRREDLYKSYLTFEKKHGNKEGIEKVLLTRQRKQYNMRVDENPYDYDAWFEFAKLEEDSGSIPSVRDVYERAVAQVPPSMNKDHWRRYIFLWIYYATYEELSNQDTDRASQIYQACLKVIPHKEFTFAKVWIYAAKVHVRRKDLASARRLLGRAIGVCAKERIFTEYIAIELSLGEIDRCRALYNNYLKAMPHSCVAWSKYAELEKSLGETERCRAIFELAITQPALDMPEVVWKGYIDFEIDEGEAYRARKLYERLLEKTSHVKVWMSFGQFEASEIGKGMSATRSTFQNAYDRLKEQNLKEERVLLLDAWRALEQDKGDAESVEKVEKMLPRRIKRKRMRKDADDNELGWEEYFDYQFPDEDQSGSSNLKILEMAAKWKKSMAGSSDEDSEDEI